MYVNVRSAFCKKHADFSIDRRRHGGFSSKRLPKAICYSRPVIGAFSDGAGGCRQTLVVLCGGSSLPAAFLEVSFGGLGPQRPRSCLVGPMSPAPSAKARVNELASSTKQLLQEGQYDSWRKHANAARRPKGS